MLFFFKHPSHLLAVALYTHLTLRRRHNPHENFLELAVPEARTPAPAAALTAMVAAPTLIDEDSDELRGLITFETRVRHLMAPTPLSAFLALRIMSSFVNPLENTQGRLLELQDLHGVNLITFSLATMIKDSSSNLIGVLLLKRLLICVDDTFMWAKFISWSDLASTTMSASHFTFRSLHESHEGPNLCRRLVCPLESEMAILGESGIAGDVGVDEGSLEYGEEPADVTLSDLGLWACWLLSAAWWARILTGSFTLAYEAALDKLSKFCSVNLDGWSNTAKLLTGGSTTEDNRGILSTIGSGMV